MENNNGIIPCFILLVLVLVFVICQPEYDQSIVEQDRKNGRLSLIELRAQRSSNASTEQVLAIKNQPTPTQGETP